MGEIAVIYAWHLKIGIISEGQRKKDVTPLLTYWSYVFLALTHGYHAYDVKLQFFINMNKEEKRPKLLFGRDHQSICASVAHILCTM